MFFVRESVIGALIQLLLRRLEVQLKIVALVCTTIQRSQGSFTSSIFLMLRVLVSLWKGSRWSSRDVQKAAGHRLLLEIR